LMKRHPQLAIQVDLADANELAERLHRREIDLFIADTRDLKKQPGLTMKRLPNVPVSFFVAPGHPLLAREGVTLDQALDFPVGSPQLPTGVNEHFDKQVKRSGRALFNVVCDDLGTLFHLAATAQAVVLAPDFAAPIAGGESLVRLPLERMSGMRTHYSLVMPANRTPSPAALAFSSLVQELIAAPAIG